MKNNPLVSIIIPVYNHKDEKFFRECLDSAINQTLKNIEIICVNDASTDNSLEIMNEYAAKDKRVRIVNKTQNSGTLVARKDGIMASTGNFIMFMDHDDYIVPNACETAYNLIVKNDVDILCFSFAIHDYDGNGNLSNIRIYNPEEGGKIFYGRETIQSFYFLEHKGNVALWDKIFKTELLKLAYSKMDNFYCYLGEDIYARYYIYYYALTMMTIVTEPLYIYCYGRGISSREMPLEKLEQYCKTIFLENRIKKFLKREATIGEQEKFFSEIRRHRQYFCHSLCSKQVKPENSAMAVKILYQYFNEKKDAHEIILHSLTELRNNINQAANLEKTNKNLLAQMNYENKNARIKELQDWSKEQLKAKEWFLSQIKYKDERIAELEKVSGFCYKILTKIFRILRGKN